MTPLPPRGPGTGGLRREQAPVSCAPAMASDHPQSRELATTQRAGSHEDPLTASSGRREGDGTRSRGLTSPSRRMFSTAPVGGLVLLVLTRFTEVHISSPVPSMCLRAKDHLEGTKVAVLPSLCAPQEDESGSAADWRSPKSDEPGRRRATWLPEEEQATQRRQMVGYG